MDDCTLQKLLIKPGKLSPVFRSDHNEYHVIVGSDVESATFDCLTNDSGASYSILGAEGGRAVKLIEGQLNEVKIEVTAEDGTTQVYLIHVNRLSAKDATLSDLKLNPGILQPSFSADVTEYTCLVTCDTAYIKVDPMVASEKTTLLVDGEKPGTPVSLNVGRTRVSILVTSADGSNTQIYTVTVSRRQVGLYVKFDNNDKQIKFQCPISLSPAYQPINIRDSEPQFVFSAPILEELTKTSKVHPFSETALGENWKIENYELDKEMSSAVTLVPLVNGGFSEKVKFGEIGAILKTCHQLPKLETGKKFEANVALKHTIEARKWEKKLQQIFDENDPTALVKMAEKDIENYLASIPEPGATKRFIEGESPMDYLQHAIHCYATAIKYKPKDARLHLQLALTLEEKYLAEDILGFKKTDQVDFPSMNVEAKESSKSDECAAICRLRGVPENAPLASQLKAIDEEYHHLLSSGQGAKADHVQALHAWKSKQAVQGGVASQQAADEQSCLGQAYLKYLDALSSDDAKASYHFHVGRMLVMQANYEQAIPRLQAAIAWNNQLQQARFYLGLALSLKPDGAGTRSNEAIGYLAEGMHLLLKRNCEDANKIETDKRKHLYVEDLISKVNIYVLRGIIQLGKLRSKVTADCMTAEDIFHNAALLAVQVLPSIARGALYQQVEWILLESHSALLQLLVSGGQTNTGPMLASRCLVLSALIKRSTLEQTSDLLQLQQQTSQMLAETQPASSYALYLLGNTQLTQFENEPPGETANQFLSDAKLSFQASIEMEGKPSVGPPPEKLKEQFWWQNKMKQQQEAAAAAAAAESVKMSSTPTRGGGGGGATANKAARGAATNKAVAGTTGRGTAGRGAAGRGATGRGASITPARGGGVARGAGKTGKNVPVTSSSKTCATPVTPPGDETKTDDKTEKPAQPKSTEINSPLNKKTHHARLGLARAFAKNESDVEQAKKYYSEVIDMAPEIHDAYVESANMLVNTDMMAAVDIYSRFPTCDEPSFDDAFIFGEIVRLLMKCGKYDDSRLGPNLIGMGRVMGIGALEKYVTILDDKGRSNLLKTVYAGVNRKEVNDPDMQAFFKVKCWI